MRPVIDEKKRRFAGLLPSPKLLMRRDKMVRTSCLCWKQWCQQTSCVPGLAASNLHSHSHIYTPPFQFVNLSVPLSVTASKASAALLAISHHNGNMLPQIQKVQRPWLVKLVPYTHLEKMYKLQKAAYLHCFVIRLYLSSQPNKHLWMGCSQNAVTITSNSWSSHQIHTKHQSAAVDGKLPHLLAIIHLFLLFILLCQDVFISQKF